MLSNFAIINLGIPQILIVLITSAIFIFEIVMFVSAVSNKLITTNRKVLWIVGMLLLSPFVAIGYYFTDYKKKL